MTLKEQIEKDFIDAYKSKKEMKVSVLRMVKTAIKNFEINLKKEATDQEIIGILKKEFKQRQEALAEMKKAKRDDLIAKETSEIEILEQYMPKQLSDEELKKIVVSVLFEENYNDPKDLGKAIGSVIKKVEGQADGGRVSAFVKELLSK